MSDNGCYGNPPDNTVQSSCNTGEVIVIESVYGYAKPKSSGCPNIQGIVPVNESCCKYAESDCGVRYDGVSESNFYDDCQGRQSCPATNVAWTISTCGTDFLPFTNYMVMYYQCIVGKQFT